MNITELQPALIALTKRNITQVDIAKSLSITPQTVSSRIKTKSELTSPEVSKINSYFKVDLLNTNMINNTDEDEFFQQINTFFKIPEADLTFVKSILLSQPERSLHIIFKKAISGNADAVEICKSLLNDPKLVNVFLSR